MTAGLPYLRNLRKSDLIELAENSKLRNYLDLRKSDLELALDKHLWSNRSKLSADAALADYYKRAGSAAAPATTGASKTPSRSRTRNVSDESDDSSLSESPISMAKSVKRTPTRTRAAASSIASSTASSAATAASAAAAKSPRLAATLNQVSERSHSLMSKVTEFLEESDVTAHFRLLREYLGNAWSIQIGLLIIEMVGLARNLIPRTQLFDFSHFKLWLFQSPMPLSAVYTLDPRFFFTSLCWSVVSLYVTIGHIIPLFISYIANPTVGANLTYSSGGGGSRRSTRFSGGKICFDPLMFALSRGLLMHHVLKNKGQFSIFDWIWSPGVVDFLAQSLPGGVSWVTTRSCVGVVVTLYEAVLRK